MIAGLLLVNTTAQATENSRPAPSVRWSNVAPSLYPYSEGAGAALNGKLYTFGGYQSSNWDIPQARAQVYDIANNRWSELPSVPNGVTHAARAVDGSKIYLVGGVVPAGDSETFGTKAVWIFDTQTNTWNAGVSLPQARGSGGAVVIDRKLHFFGGVDVNQQPKSDHWVLDLDRPWKGWSRDTAFPAGLSHFATVAVGTTVYVIGGQTGWDDAAVAAKSVYKFNTRSHRWSRIADMPQGVSHAEESTLLLNGRIWVFGGQLAPPAGTRSAHVLDLSTGKWTAIADAMPDWRFAAVAGAVGNTVYFTGGSIDNPAAWKGIVS